MTINFSDEYLAKREERIVPEVKFARKLAPLFYSILTKEILA